MSNESFLAALLGVLAMAGVAFGHGEDKPGPHGGAIRMPGAFHTELVKESPTKFKIYLLDIDFKKPVTKNSEVKANGIACKPRKKYFECSLPKPAKEVTILAKREGAGGGAVTYPLVGSGHGSGHNHSH